MLLLPEHYPTVPFVESTDLLGHPEALRQRAEAEGYLYLRGLFSDAEVAGVRAMVRAECARNGWVLHDPDNPPSARPAPGAYFEGRGWDDPRFVALQRLLIADPGFKELATDPRVMSVLETLWGEPAALAVANHVWVKLPGSPENTTRPHQDTFYLPACPRMWTIWYPIAHTPLGVGPLAVIPGSHTREWTHRSAMEGIDVPRDVTWATGAVHSGDVVIFAARTVHCAWSNVSPEEVRMSLDVRYEPAATAGSILRPRGA